MRLDETKLEGQVTPEDELAYQHAIRTAPDLMACLLLIRAQDEGRPFLEGVRWARRQKLWYFVQTLLVVAFLLLGFFGPVIVEALERRARGEPVDAQHVESER